MNDREVRDKAIPWILSLMADPNKWEPYVGGIGNQFQYLTNKALTIAAMDYEYGGGYYFNIEKVAAVTVCKSAIQDPFNLYGWKFRRAFGRIQAHHRRAKALKDEAAQELESDKASLSLIRFIEEHPDAT